jgi:glycosyltransferase involved in cell wall biosynthesis
MIGMFSLGLMQRIPTVISLDATFNNFLTMAAVYKYGPPNKAVYSLKLDWYRRMFHSAVALVTWSTWAKDSLIQDYGVTSDKVLVIPPGVDLHQWCPKKKEVEKDRPLQLLFVGGDFERKGGHVLLEAFHRGLAEQCTLDIVTKDETVCSEGSVRVHRGLTPNSPLLRQLFADADLFVFPTLGDCTPVVVIEAMAAGLPVLATNVGALAEEVEDGVTGLLVPPNDPGALLEAIRSLANTPDRLVAMGAAGRARAERLFDAKHNYKAVVDVLKRCVNERRNRACLLPSRQKNPEEYVFTQEGQGSQREIHSLRVGME